MGTECSGLQRREIICLKISVQFKSISDGVLLMLVELAVGTSGKAPAMLKDRHRFYSNILEKASHISVIQH